MSGLRRDALSAATSVRSASSIVEERRPFARSERILRLVRWLVRLGIGLATVAVVIALTLALRPDPSEATGVVDGPVVALPYPNGIRPMADVWGDLTLRGDCLMLGDAVVFWPAGTSWDAESHSVVFSGDFDGSVSVGSHFEGGGGVYSLTDDFLRGLGDAGDVLRDCVAATGARDVRLAYP